MIHLTLSSLVYLDRGASSPVRIFFEQGNTYPIDVLEQSRVRLQGDGSAPRWDTSGPF